VNVFLNAARNRAIQSGRPWGVVIERQRGFPSAGVLLHLSHVPPLYGGNSQSAAMRLCTLSVDPQTGVATVGATVKRGQISPGLVRPGDVVYLNGHSQEYLVLSVNGSDSDGYFDDRKLSEDKEGWLQAPTQAGGFPLVLQIGLRPGSSPTVLPWPVADPSTASFPRSEAVRFLISMQPERSAAGSLQLPEGTCIDLGGIDALGSLLATSGLDQGDLGTFRPRPANPSGSPPVPEDVSPVVILFSPNGGVERVYCWWWDTITPTATWQGRPPLGPVYLLIGQRDKVNRDITRPPGQQSNLEDLNSLWVVIQPTTGIVTTAQNSLMQNPYDVWNARRRAREQAGLGGR
jgi:hypothetical protein